jgi:hypothetical protein
MNPPDSWCSKPSPGIKHRPWAVALSGLGLVLGLVSAPAAEAQCYTKVKTQGCEGHKGSKELRCLNDAKLETQTAQVVVTNKSGRVIRFLYDEWHSKCGEDGTRIHSQQFTVPVGRPATFTQLAPGPGTTCREGFILQCKNPDGSNVNCAEVIDARLESFKGNQQ